MLVVFAGEGRFGAFFAEDAKLLCSCVGQLRASTGVFACQACIDGQYAPLFNCIRHSSSDFCRGYDIFLDSAVWKRLPKKGIVGIELRRAIPGRAADTGNGAGAVR